MANNINKESIDTTINKHESTQEIHNQVKTQESIFMYNHRQICSTITAYYQRFLNNQERRKVRKMNPQERGEYFMKLHKKDYHK
jgi:hypothetical protein